jgi:hypothetical protein
MLLGEIPYVHMIKQLHYSPSYYIYNKSSYFWRRPSANLKTASVQTLAVCLEERGLISFSVG